MQSFPIGSVSIEGKMVDNPADRFANQVAEITPETATKNPVPQSVTSLENGKYIFDTYCIVCHSDSRETNEEGFATTEINKLGMIAPALISISHQFNDGYIHKKIKFGGAVMPPLGYATTEQERWDVVNYIRKLETQP